MTLGIQLWALTPLIQDNTGYGLDVNWWALDDENGWDSQQSDPELNHPFFSLNMDHRCVAWLRCQWDFLTSDACDKSETATPCGPRSLAPQVFAHVMGAAKLPTSNSILILNKLLFVLWRLCSWIFTFLEVWWMQKEKDWWWKEKWTRSVQSRCLYRWMNGPLTVFRMISINWLTESVMSLFSLARAQCAQRVQPLSCYELCDECSVVCVLIGSITWF